jgi:hypothetical protein
MRYSSTLITLLVAGMIALSVPAQASVSGRRNTAYGATGLALYELATGHTTTGLLAAAGAGYAWHQYQVAHQRSSRRSAFLSGYATGVRHAYRRLYRPVRYRGYYRRR